MDGWIHICVLLVPLAFCLWINIGSQLFALACGSLCDSHNGLNCYLQGRLPTVHMSK